MVKTTMGFRYRFSQLNQSVVTCASFKLQPQFLIFSDHKTTHWTCVEYTAEDSGKTRSHASSIPGTTPWIWGLTPLAWQPFVPIFRDHPGQGQRCRYMIYTLMFIYIYNYNIYIYISIYIYKYIYI